MSHHVPVKLLLLQSETFKCPCFHIGWSVSVINIICLFESGRNSMQIVLIVKSELNIDILCV